MSRAAIDLGSNSVLLTVLDEEGRLVHDEARVVALGRSLGDGGQFLPDRMEATQAALTDYVRTASRLGVSAPEIRAVATSAARRATNAPAFFDSLEVRLGLRLQIISGEEEARLAYLGARVDLPTPQGPFLVIDVGGGSTELILGRGPEIARRISVESGSVRLTESHLGIAPTDTAVASARAHVESLVASFDWDPSVVAAIAVAGTATTLAAMDAGLNTYDGAVVHGHPLSRARLQHWSARLQTASPDERKSLARVSPQRADVLLAGALLIDTVLAAAGLDGCTVSDRGLRFGLLTGARPEFSSPPG